MKFILVNCSIVSYLIFLQHVQVGGEIDISAGNTGGYASKGPQSTSALAAKVAVSSQQQDTEVYTMAGAGTEPKVLFQDDKAVVFRRSIASQADRNYSMVGDNGFQTPLLKVPKCSDKEAAAPSISTTAISAEHTYDRAVVKSELDTNLRFEVHDMDRKLSAQPSLDCPPEFGADPDAVYSAPVLMRIDPAAHTAVTGEDLYSHATTTANYRFISPSNVEMKGLVAAG